MWWRRRREVPSEPEPPLDRATVDGIISLLMRIDARVERLIELEEENGEEESDA